MSHLKFLFADSRFSWAHQESNFLFTITRFQPGGGGIGCSMFTAWLASISRSIVRRIRRVCTTQNYLNLHLLMKLSSCNWTLVSSLMAPYLHSHPRTRSCLVCQNSVSESYPSTSVPLESDIGGVYTIVEWVVVPFKLALAFVNSNGSTQLSDIALNSLKFGVAALSSNINTESVCMHPL